MPMLMLALTLLVFLSGACVAASASGDILAKGDDARLEQRVAFSAEGVRLADVMASLSESTGVVMAAGVDKDDWMVYDRKVIVYVRDMKLADLMRELSSVLRFHWSRAGEAGKWTYTLSQDAEERAEEESLRSKNEDARSLEARRKRENAISDIVNLSSLDAASVESLKSNDPWRYVLATEPLGRDLADFVNSFPEARNALMQGTQAGFPVSTLPSQVQEMVKRIAVSYDSLTKSIGAAEDRSSLLSRFARLQVSINHRTPLDRDDVMTQSLLGKISIGDGVEAFEIPLFEPSSPIARVLGRAIVALKSGRSKEDVAKQLQTDLTAAAEFGTTGAGPVRDVTSDPAFRTKVALFSENVTVGLPTALKALFSAGYDVVSDYFLSQPANMQGGDRTLGEQLETIRAAFGSNWEKRGRLLRFRDQEWFRKRTYEVPQVWINYWSARGKMLDGLQFSDLVQIGNLRDDQIDHTIMLTPALVRMGAGDAARNRHILRFYAQLSDEQSKQLSDSALQVSSLTDGQWSALQEALVTKGAAYAGVQRASQTVRLTQTGRDIVDYTFTYDPGAGDPPVSFKLTTGLAFKTGDEIPMPKGEPANKITEPLPPP